MRDSHFNFHQKIAMLFILIYIFFMFSSFFRFFICDCVIPVFPWLPIQILTQKKGLIFELWLHDFHFNFHQKIAMLFILTSPGVTRILVPDKRRIMRKPRNTGTRCMYSITYIPKNNTINQVPSIMAGQMLAMFSWIMMIRLVFSARLALSGAYQRTVAAREICWRGVRWPVQIHYRCACGFQNFVWTPV